MARKHRKVSAALTAAVAIQGLAACDEPKRMRSTDDDRPKAPQKTTEAELAVKAAAKAPKQTPTVEKIPEQRRPSDSDMDLAMPAGTLYDVIRRRNIPS